MSQTTTSLKLPDGLKEKVSAIAHEVAQTPHAYMVEAIAEKVARDEKRQAFLESARQSRAEVARTGTVYGHAQVKRYLTRKAKGRKATKPKPIRIPAAER